MRSINHLQIVGLSLGFPQKQGFLLCRAEVSGSWTSDFLWVFTHSDVGQIWSHNFDLRTLTYSVNWEFLNWNRYANIAVLALQEIACFFLNVWLIAHIIHRSYCHSFGIEMLTENEFVVYKRVFLTTAGATGEFV